MALYKSVYYYYYYYGEGRGPGPLKYFCLEPALGRRRCVACAEGASLGRARAKRSASSMNETNCSVDNDRVTATHTHTRARAAAVWCTDRQTLRGCNSRSVGVGGGGGVAAVIAGRLSSLPVGTTSDKRRASEQTLRPTELKSRNAASRETDGSTNAQSHPSRTTTIEAGDAPDATVIRRNTGLGSRVVSVLDSGAEGPGFKSQPRRCRVTVLGKLFTPIVPLFTKQRNW